MTNSIQKQIYKMMTTTPPAFSNDRAVHIAAKHYGVKARAQPLVSERDQNFRMTSSDGTCFTLKIANHAEQLQVIDFQNQALLHVARQDASIPLPRVIPSLEKAMYCSVELDGKTHFVRMISWLDGTVLNDFEAGPDLLGKIGGLMARLGVALAGFDHPGSNPPLLWDMKRAAGLRDLLVHIDEAELNNTITRTLDRFVLNVEPRLAGLRTQVIHNDFNPDNVLLDKTDPSQVSGIIDFGDLVKSPLIIDLAVAASYQLSDGDDPLAGALPLIAGYNAVTPLQQAEIELLTDLIRTRLITSLLIGNWRVKLFPENSEYLWGGNAQIKRCLIHLDALDNDVAHDRISMCLQTGH